MSGPARRPRRRRLLAPGINLTPLLDAILNLTFFFLVATTIRKEEAAVNIALPESQTAAAVPGAARPSISIDGAGEILYEGRRLEEAELELTLRGLAAKGRTEIDIRGDEQADYGRVFRLMDLCRKAGLKAVNLDARKERHSPREAPPGGGQL